MPRKNIHLRKLATPKRVQLPKGRVFSAKHQRVPRNVLPKRVRVRRTCVRKIGPRKQAGHGMPT